MNYFEGIKTIEELKKAYRIACKKLHPDLGGSESEFKAMNKEYESLLSRLPTENSTKTDSEFDWKKDRFADIIQKIITFDIDIQIIGSWIWCFNSYAYKDQLKELGFWYSGAKKAWIFSGSPKKGRGHYSMSKIRQKFKCEDIKTQKQEKLA